MSNVSLVSQFLIVLVTAIALILIGLDVGDGSDSTSSSTPSNHQKPNKVPTSKIVRPSPPTENQVELSSKVKTQVESALATYKTTRAFEEYKPRYTQAAIHHSNYGDRYSTDVNGNSLNNSPIVVLHETTDSVTSAINTFRTPHSNDSNQVSYHALIALDGMIIYLVPSDKRAFGAGNSVFESPSGIETVQTNPNLPSSVNNFAYHISLETPPDGRKRPNQNYHSGYTDSQYKSLAWLLALSNIPDDRITTHKNVDRSSRKIDPRSFDFDKFFQILHAYRQPAMADVSTPTKTPDVD